jgi:hypothetical protein
MQGSKEQSFQAENEMKKMLWGYAFGDHFHHPG